jgi:hypothetical protein
MWFLVSEMKEISHMALSGVVLHALDALSAFAAVFKHLLIGTPLCLLQ